MKHKKLCLFCGNRFLPAGRNKKQRVCLRKRCQKKRKLKAWRRWAARNKSVKRLKLRVWSRAYPNYWRHYRAAHGTYRRKDIRRRVKARRRAKSVRKANPDARR